MLDAFQDPPRVTSAELVAETAEALALRWDDNEFALDPLGSEAALERARAEPAACLTYLDCGVWTGDNSGTTPLRTFGVLCGRTVALCEFCDGEALTDVAGPPDEVGPLNRTLRALAGPQRLDVRVLRSARSPWPAPASTGARELTTHVFLPDMHLPIVMPMPDFDPNIIPDPTRATCFCHGPLMARILYGQPVAGEYAAVGCTIGRDANEWFFLMADRYRGVAEDLRRFLSRLTRHARSAPLALVQLGGLFEIWAGYALEFHATGRMGMVMPRIVRGSTLADYERAWQPRALATPNREALDLFARFGACDRVVLCDDYEYLDAMAARAPEEPPARRTHAVPGLYFAEHRPPARSLRHDRPPVGVMAPLEQQARVLPWMRALPQDYRELFVAHAVQARLVDPARAGHPVYVMAYSHVPCLTQVHLR